MEQVQPLAATEVETPERPKRKYEKVWDKLIKVPGNTVKVKVKSAELIPRIRKAVQKEKDLCNAKSKDGFPIKKLYRLEVEVLEDGVTVLFKLVPTLHIGNL